MDVKVKASKSYYVTEVSVDLPADAREVDELVRGLRTNGKVVSVYNGGNMQGLSIEQRTKIPDGQVDKKIREILGVGAKYFTDD